MELMADGRRCHEARESPRIGDHGRVVSLEPMSPDAWEAWKAASIRGYAAEKVTAGTWPADGAHERAVAEFGELLPAGQSTPGHEFRAIVADGVGQVGVIWLAPLKEIGRGSAFIYDIVIDEEQRGHGYGRAAMLEFEREAARRGLHHLSLNVFGGNAPARGLYSSLGWAEAAITMTKHLDQ